MVVKFEHKKHGKMLQGWLAAKNIQMPAEDMFSDLGYTVDDTCIGFLFITNSGQAWIDNVAANPHCDADKRNTALTVLFDTLEAKAKELNYKLVTALANLPTMTNRFESRGYKPHANYTLYYKELKE